MKASSVLLAVFSGLAIAAPALDPRQNVDKLNAAVDALNKKNAEVKEQIGISVDEQAERHQQWKDRSNQQVDLINQAKEQARDGPPEQKEVLDKLANLIDIAAQKADEASDRLDKQEEKREADNQDYVNIANDLEAAIDG